jgi:hypothetical protein
MAAPTEQAPPASGVPYRMSKDEFDTLEFVTSVKPKNTRDNKGTIDAGILDKFDSILSPNISFANYTKEQTRSQMWRAKLIGSRVIDSYSDQDYDPLILAKVEAAKGLVAAKVSQGKEGTNNILRVLRSVWTHMENIQQSKHEEKAQLHTKGGGIRGR